MRRSSCKAFQRAQYHLREHGEPDDLLSEGKKNSRPGAPVPLHRLHAERRSRRSRSDPRRTDLDLPKNRTAVPLAHLWNPASLDVCIRREAWDNSSLSELISCVKGGLPGDRCQDLRNDSELRASVTSRTIPRLFRLLATSGSSGPRAFSELLDRGLLRLGAP